ncbi:PSP1 domain-containing protein [Bacteroides ilei]|uniref:PSP1 domain-containing protein n=1 Tax=Bacteroides ilei TaxID=1907658 RepID=UPI000930A1D1|nr:regulatory iron-sulfur-containing complex subunit RicT [Bacteroides ilei]
MSKFILKNGSGPLCCKGCGRQDNKLNTYDWLADIPGNSEEQEMVEVQFKNTRKGYFKNSNHLKLEKGDIVAVEASPGHDIGTVTLTGRLVPLQMRKANLKPDIEIKRVYRKAKPVDLEKYEEAKKREHDTMIRSRQIAADLGLQMKIGDVEYQGDGNKAIFYYIADERVDFRQLIKVLAEAFRVRIEMKQIGARQEAGRIGGIGPCGRELCCATWMTNFVSVSTSAARYQDISLNPQKLAGQCAKLKCCLNYEVDAYVECQKRLPSKEITLETQDATYYYFKADILKGTITYSTDKSFLANEATITARRAFEIINMNKHGEKPEKLQDNGSHETGRSKDLLEQESLTRFDKSKNAKNRKKKKADAPNEFRQGAQPAQPETQTEEANGTTKRNEGRQNESRKKERNNRNNGGNQENNGNRQRLEKQEKQQKAQQQPAPQKNLPLPITAENNMQNPQDNRRDDKNNNRRRERNNRHRTKRHNDNETGNGNPDPTPQA